MVMLTCNEWSLAVTCAFQRTQSHSTADERGTKRKGTGEKNDRREMCRERERRPERERERRAGRERSGERGVQRERERERERRTERDRGVQGERKRKEERKREERNTLPLPPVPQ